MLALFSVLRALSTAVSGGTRGEQQVLAKLLKCRRQLSPAGSSRRWGRAALHSLPCAITSHYRFSPQDSTAAHDRRSASGTTSAEETGAVSPRQAAHLRSFWAALRSRCWAFFRERKLRRGFTAMPTPMPATPAAKTGSILTGGVRLKPGRFESPALPLDVICFSTSCSAVHPVHGGRTASSRSQIYGGSSGVLARAQDDVQVNSGKL